MNDFATAALKFPMAISSFGVQRLLEALPLADSTAGRTARANFYKAGDSATGDFSANAALFGAFQVGDMAQSALIHLAADAMRLKVLKPSYVWHAVSELFDLSSDAYESVATSDSRRLLSDELSNTFDAIGLRFQDDLPAEVMPDGKYPLAEMLERQYSRGDYPAVWLVEELGERYAQALLDDGRILKGLLSRGDGLQLPVQSLAMMHAGMGAAFAKLAIGPLTPFSSDGEIEGALRTFLEMVNDNAQARFRGAALEALGFVTRTRYGQMVGPVSEHLAAIDEASVDFFWHGVGRAMYFSPVSMVPGLSPWHAVAQEVPDDRARRNARAGIAWAFTMVNLRQPEIVANFLLHRADDIAGDDAFTDGVYSALIVAAETVPGHRFVTGFCRYHQDPEEYQAVAAWRQHLGGDCETRVKALRETLRANGKLGELFRHQRLQDFVEAPKKAPAPAAAKAGAGRKRKRD